MRISGTAVPGMATVDVAISELMTRWDIPGSSVGIMKDGRLVYARRFGYADVEAQWMATPDALFRIASVAKPVTAAAVRLQRVPADHRRRHQEARRRRRATAR